MNNAVVIGYGVVGKATAKAFGIDKYYSRSDSNITLEQARNYRYIFICLPTPTINRKCNTSGIEKIIGEITKYPATTKNIFIIRSTVNPGFNRYLQATFGIENQSFVSNPEFLSEDTAEEDAKNPDLIVIGADDSASGVAVHGIYQARFKYKDIVHTDSVTAEFIKLVLNSFFALKVMFANQIYDPIQHMKANYETIREVLEKHPWGSKNHFQVEYKGKRGIHGKCLPKDLEAFAEFTDSQLLRAVDAINKQRYVR